MVYEEAVHSILPLTLPKRLPGIAVSNCKRTLLQKISVVRNKNVSHIRNMAEKFLHVETCFSMQKHIIGEV